MLRLENHEYPTARRGKILSQNPRIFKKTKNRIKKRRSDSKSSANFALDRYIHIFIKYKLNKVIIATKLCPMVTH